LTSSSISPFIREYGIDEVLLAPVEEMSTYTLEPASCAALAISTFSPCSILYWFSKPPAAPRVVAKAEMKMLGVGVSAESWLAQVEVSFVTIVVSLAWGASAAACGVRREMVSMRVTAGLAMRLFRMWAPCCHR
jgi:hypothetical protein